MRHTSHYISSEQHLRSFGDGANIEMAENTAEELERFRQQWQAEVSARSKDAASSSISSRPAQTGQRSSGTTQPELTAAPTFHKPYRDVDGVHDVGEHEYHDLDDKDEARKLGESGEGIHPSARREPTSALEHYERAVERELEGSLGDSLYLYRRAFRVRSPSYQSKPPVLIHGFSSMQASTVSTEQNTFHPPHSNRNPLTRTHPMPLLQSLALLTIP